MTTYRVVRRQYANLSGDGARQYGGRFNPPGIPAIYTSQSIALALLEILVHIDKSEVPNDYVVMAIRFNGRNVARRSGPDLANTRQLTIPQFTDLFYRWPVLRVPSVIVPQEHNFILFPEATGFEATVASIDLLNFDRRLFSAIES